MEIIKYGAFSINERTVFLDVDDVVLKTEQTIVDILNEKCHTNKTVEDHVDWGFKSINRNVTLDMIQEIVSSSEFWQRVQPYQQWFQAFETTELFNQYDWVFVTSGSRENLILKMEYLKSLPFFSNNKRNWDLVGYYGILPSESKSSVNMLGRIQIDDNYNNLLKTDADIKILIKNGKDTQYNTCRHASDNLDNLYIVNNIEEALDVLQFIALMEQSGEDFTEGMVTETDII